MGGSPYSRKSSRARSSFDGSGTTILLLDRHALTRTCIASLLLRADRRISVHTFPGIADVPIDRLPRVHLTLWNLASMRITNGLVKADLNAIRQTLADVPLVVLSKHSSTAEALQAIRLGARGFIPTSLSLPVMVAALRLVLAGGVYLAPVDDETVLLPAVDSVPSADPLPPGGDVRQGLTSREEEVLALLRQGKPNKLIAYELQMSQNTVKVHVGRIIKKLKVMNRTEAAGVVAGLDHAPGAFQASSDRHLESVLRP